MKKSWLTLSVIMVALTFNLGGLVHAQDLQISSPSLVWTWNTTEHFWET